MGRPRIVEGEYYHVYNRGVEKRRIFWDGRDRVRFIHDLYEFNDRAATTNMRYLYGDTSSIVVPKSSLERDLLVDILAYAMMPNHYHFLLRAKSDDGISLFMQKLGIGYTLYVNERHERSGVLFQGKHKIKYVDEDRYLRYLLLYIHANPLGLFQRKGRDATPGSKVASWEKFEAYRWSSYRDYVGECNFPSLLNLQLARDLAFPMGDAHRSMLRSWQKDEAALGQGAQRLFIDE